MLFGTVLFGAMLLGYGTPASLHESSKWDIALANTDCAGRIALSRRLRR